VGGFAVGGAANGLTSWGGRGCSYPLTRGWNPFSYLLCRAPWPSSLGGGRPEAWERCLPSSPPRPRCAGRAGRWEGWMERTDPVHTALRSAAQSRAGGPFRVRLLIRARPLAGVLGDPGVVSVPPRVFAGRSVTKSRLGGGDGRREATALAPHLLPPPPLPRPAREEEQFVYLGLEEPSLLPAPRGRPTPPPRPSLRRAPARSRRLRLPPPLLRSLPASSSLPSGPPSPPSWNAAVGEGAGGALSASQRSAAWGGALRPSPAPSVARGRASAGLARLEADRGSQVGEGAFRLQTGSRKPLTHSSFAGCPGGGAGPAA
jgi:hypothetical protein